MTSIKQAEIWLLNLDPTIGAEIRKTRPALVVSDDGLGKLPLKIVTPITDWKDAFEVAPWMVKIVPNKNNNLSKISAVDCFQVRSVSEQRFSKKIGSVSSELMDEVRVGLARVLSMDS